MSGNSLEEIKLLVENVKWKKNEGSLYLMGERLAWIPKQKNCNTISHHYVDIKSFFFYEYLILIDTEKKFKYFFL
jgi:hypothetical protein